MIYVGLGQLLAGLLLIASGYMLGNDGHWLGGFDVMVGVWLFLTAIDRRGPPSPPLVRV